MNPARAAAAYEKIAEGFAELALAVGEPAAQAVPLPPFEEPAGTSSITVNVPSPSFQDTPMGRSQTGGCPVHGLPWVVKPAGTSKKTGAPYKAFWHCNEQDDDGSFCNQKPTREWADAHKIR